MKGTLIGAAQQIEDVPGGNGAKQFVVEITYTKPIAFPKGVPPLPDTPTQYRVYVGGKQWKKVQEAALDPEDLLVIEGNAAYNPTIGGMVFHAYNITSVKLQRASRPQQTSAESAKTEQASE